MIRGAVLLVAAVLAFGATSPAMGQEATPDGATDVLAGIEGVEDAALRGFGPSGMRRVGTLYLAFFVIDFESTARATEALPLVVDRTLASIPGHEVDMRPARTRTVGDETIAFVGTSLLEGTEATIAVVAIRVDDLVHVGVGTALAGDPLADVSAVLSKAAARLPGEPATPRANGGMRAGGLWDALPRLEDLPEGFVFVADWGLLDAEPATIATPAR